MSYSGEKMDLTGQRYEKLTVLRPSEGVDGRTAWVCQKRGVEGLTYVDGTCVEMLRKRPVRKNNTSGTPGVDWLEKRQRWRASICFKGKRRYLGCYEEFEDAVKARKQAEEVLFEKFLAEFSVQDTQGTADG